MPKLAPGWEKHDNPSGDIEVAWSYEHGKHSKRDATIVRVYEPILDEHGYEVDVERLATRNPEAASGEIDTTDSEEILPGSAEASKTKAVEAARNWIKDNPKGLEAEMSDSQIRRRINDKVMELAAGDAATAWSYIGDGQKDKLHDKGYKELAQVASFRDKVAINGQPVHLSDYNPTDLYQSDEWEATGHGGKVPSAEAEVQLDNLVGMPEKIGVDQERFWSIVDDMYGEDAKNAYISVSGETTLYGRK